MIGKIILIFLALVGLYFIISSVIHINIYTSSPKNSISSYIENASSYNLSPSSKNVLQSVISSIIPENVIASISVSIIQNLTTILFPFPPTSQIDKIFNKNFTFSNIRLSMNSTPYFMNNSFVYNESFESFGTYSNHSLNISVGYFYLNKKGMAELSKVNPSGAIKYNGAFYGISSIYNFLMGYKKPYVFEAKFNFPTTNQTEEEVADAIINNLPTNNYSSS